MKNSNLFNTNTIRLRCFGCGRLFDITEMKQCSACKELFCAECQKTHDCTADTTAAPEAPAAPAEPAALIPAPQITERVETPVKMSEDEAYSAYVREINPFIMCEECGESYPLSDMWKCPGCGIVLCQICREKHRCPKPEQEKKSVLAFLPVLGSKIAERNADAQERGGEEKGDAEEEQIVCDGCGKSFPKSKMRRCQNCGAVLCPKCRILHSCAGHGDKKGKDKDKDKDKAKDKDKQQKDAAQKDAVQMDAAQKDAAEQLFGTQTAPPVKKTPHKEESPETKESSPRSTETKGKKEEEEQIVCDGCGNSFPKSKMRKCRECGDVLCPKCRKKHVCREKTGDTRTKEQE